MPRNAPLLDSPVSTPESTANAVREEETALAPVRQSGGELELILRMAADPNVPVDKLERLLAMHERMADRQAKVAFDSAFAEMAADLPTVVEKASTNNGTYATLEDIIETVRPVLRRHGFALSHRSEFPDKGTVKIVGILTHAGGHSRESEFLSGADASGNKNAIQGLGSAVSYGRRYTTKDLLNIVTRKEDDDGRKTETKQQTAPDGYEAIREGLEDVAAEGWERLRAEWGKTPQPFRDFVFKNEAKWWARVKAKAEAVTKGAARA